MLLKCDLCGNAYFQLAKVPCGYYIENKGDKYTLVMPDDDSAFRNVCLKCIFSNSDKEL